MTPLVTPTAIPSIPPTAASPTVSLAAATPTRRPAESRVPFKAESDLLKGHFICIDPGHGKYSRAAIKTEPIAPGSKETKASTTTGTQGVYSKIPEYVVNFKVSQLLREKLEKAGCKVLFTHESIDDNYGNIDRCNFIAQYMPELTIRIHCNGNVNHSINGVDMFIPGDKYLKNEKLIAESKRVGQIILDEYAKDTGMKNRGCTAYNDLTGFNWSKVPVVLIEMGFMSNQHDDLLLASDFFQEKAAEGLYQGILKAYGK